ncbi:hypothetical protein EDB92DRAFT_1886616 [Lactarius akahatsu]|uniref:Peptidase S53 activation domain-containing protein n=1 Tax=Lactarius akahatsu TaxID=416441 RepID=A0AAD4L8K1_9AGAM|nr:hypothetical protein EDB92DRAFT_1886616 [Lactarius akahatsu]
MRYHLISALSHSWNAVPENWESLGNPLSGTTIDLYVALKAHRENALIDTLYQVSDPNHPRYGAYLSREQEPSSSSIPGSNTTACPSSSVSMTHGGTYADSQ